MAIFLLLPDEGGARNALASRYITQMYSALGALARDNGGRLWVPVWFLLDEFGNIPRIPGMDTKLTVAAGRGIRFLLALQDLAQLKKYGDASQTITGNCDAIPGSFCEPPMWRRPRSSAPNSAPSRCARPVTACSRGPFPAGIPSLKAPRRGRC